MGVEYVMQTEFVYVLEISLVQIVPNVYLINTVVNAILVCAFFYPIYIFYLIYNVSRLPSEYYVQ